MLKIELRLPVIDDLRVVAVTECGRCAGCDVTLAALWKEEAARRAAV